MSHQLFETRIKYSINKNTTSTGIILDSVLKVETISGKEVLQPTTHYMILDDYSHEIKIIASWRLLNFCKKDGYPISLQEAMYEVSPKPLRYNQNISQETFHKMVDEEPVEEDNTKPLRDYGVCGDCISEKETGN